MTYYPKMLLAFLLMSASRGAAGQSTEEALASKIDSLFGHVPKSGPGYIVGVIKEGRLIYGKGFGMADLDHGILMSPTSSFYMASTSKQFTAACLLALEQAGKLSLDDDIRKYLPEMPDYGTTIRLSHLLHHTSGLREYSSLLLQGGIDRQWEAKFNNETVYRLLCRQKELNFPPGEKYSYNGSGYILIAEIIKRVSGQTLRQFADSALFKPLGMKNTFFSDDYREIIPNRVNSYKKINNEYFRIVKTFDVYGDGGIISTLEDLAKWDNAFYHDLLGIPDFARKMSQVGKLADGHTTNYALGLQTHTYRGLPMIEHGGFMINFDSELMRFPEQHTSIIVLSNCWQGGQCGSMSYSYQIANICLSPYFVDSPSKPDENKYNPNNNPVINPGSLTGHYWNVNENYYNIIGYSDGRLYYDNTFGWKPTLIPLGKNLFSVQGTDITIEISGQNMFFRNPSDNTPIQYFEKYDPTAPKDISELKIYAGYYYSDELETTYFFSVKDGRLFLKINSGPLNQIFPAPKDIVWNSKSMIWLGFGEIKFSFNTSGRVTGFLMGDGRVKGVWFGRKDAPQW